MNVLEGVEKVSVPELLTLASDTKVTETLKLLLRKYGKMCLFSSYGDNVTFLQWR